MQPSAALSVDPAFARDVREGLSRKDQKQISSTWLYDDIGSVLFEAITLLPEYGLTRADARLLAEHAPDVARRMPSRTVVAELGSGSGKKTRAVLDALGRVRYYPIDVSETALALCRADLQSVAYVEPVAGTFLEGLSSVAARRPANHSLLVLFLGSTIGNFAKAEAVEFVAEIRRRLQPGDALLLGADLVKRPEILLAAYDDAAGVTAAFNRNLLARINRELDANFDLRGFAHEARYCPAEQRIEMHLRSLRTQKVRVETAEIEAEFREGETIWTESSHKYTLGDLDAMAEEAGFLPETCWVDGEWPFAECLWRV